jgi:hypothetical protein
VKRLAPNLGRPSVAYDGIAPAGGGRRKDLAGGLRRLYRAIGPAWCSGLLGRRPHRLPSEKPGHRREDLPFAGEGVAAVAGEDVVGHQDLAFLPGEEDEVAGDGLANFGERVEGDGDTVAEDGVLGEEVVEVAGEDFHGVMDLLGVGGGGRSAPPG